MRLPLNRFVSNGLRSSALIVAFATYPLAASAAPSGGHILDTPVAGVTSPQTLLRVAFQRARALGDGPLDVRGVARSNDNSLTVALFRAKHHGEAIGGLILATFARNESSRIAIVYDRADQFATTAPALIAQVRAGGGAGVAAAAVALHTVTAPDHSVRAAIPSDWNVKSFAQGIFSAIGPDGAEVDQEVSARLMDPRSPVYQQALQLQAQMRQPMNATAAYGIPLTYVGDPAHAFEAVSQALAQMSHQGNPQITIEHTIAQPAQQGLRLAEISGTEMLKGVPTRFDGIVAVSPIQQTGAWFVSIKMISAPTARFRNDLPTLSAVYNSYRVDQGVRGDQVRETIAADQAGMARGLSMARDTQARNSAVFNASMEHARSVQTSIDRSTAGFTRYLSDTTVMQNTTTGARATVNDAFAQSIVQNDPQNFRVVPVSEYRKGSEF